MDSRTFSLRLWLGGPVVNVFIVLSLAAFFTCLVRLWKVRQRFMILQKQGLSMPPYSGLLGHLLVMKKAVSQLPDDATPQYIPHVLRRSMPDLGSVFYIDAWPFSPPILILNSPSTLYQVTQGHSLPKYPNMRNFTKPIAGELNLLTMEGQIWKTWRSLFSPCFKSEHLAALLPAMIEDVFFFKNVLGDLPQKSEPFPIKYLIDNLVMDINGRLVLDSSLNCQRGSNTMVSALRRQIPWMSFGGELNLWQRWHPLRPLVHLYNSRIMDKYLQREIEERSRLRRDTSEAKLSKPIIDAVIDTCLKKPLNGDIIDPKADWTGLQQLKLFLFAGQDSTSTSICYIFHIISKHPEIRARLCAEYDAIFTSDVTQTASLLLKQPHLLNQLHYTLAVIKETLRLFPPLSSTRAGEPGFSVTGDDGRKYPTEGCLIWCVPQPIQRDGSYWSEPDAFIPERWLVGPKHPLYPVKGAWRPFEHGPRNCIGQEFAFMVMKLVMAMTCREVKIESAYDDWDQLKTTKGMKTAVGEKAYQGWNGTPRANMPCRVEVIARWTGSSFRNSTRNTNAQTLFTKKGE